MKILIDGRMLDNNSVHGIARYAHNLIHWGLQHRPQHHIVVATRQPQRWADLQREFPQLDTALVRAAPFHWKEQLDFARLFLRQRFDLAHFTSLAAPVFCLCRSLITVHDLIPWHFPSSPWHRPYLATVGRWCCWRATGILTGSQHSCRDLERILQVDPRRVTFFVYGGLDGHHIGAGGAGWRPQRPYLLCVTNPRPHKNAQVLLQAYAELAEMCDLVMVCSEFPALAEAQASYPGLHRRSGLSDADLVSLYQGAAAVVVPSTYEGFGLPVLEAMQMDAPVITSNAASLPEVAGAAALYFDPHQPDQLVQVCRQLLDSPELAQEMREKGRIQAQQFSWERCARQHWDYYESVAFASS
ncbi:glycosyltransferase family 4 protein [bacterium]|nr:glycosyltransferase family 4 protein [bacterium]